MISTSDIERDFLLGFIKIHVLHHAGEGPVYGTALIEELGRHGYRVGPSLIYPILHQLETDGYLVRAEQPVAGKVRKYYSLTDAGARALQSIKEKIRELVAEVIGADAVLSRPNPSLLSSERAIREAVHALTDQAHTLQGVPGRSSLAGTLRAIALVERTLLEAAAANPQQPDEPDTPVR